MSDLVLEYLDLPIWIILQNGDEVYLAALCLPLVNQPQ